MRRRASFRGALLAAVLAAPFLPGSAQEPAAEVWRPFTGSWTLSGQRELLPTEGNRYASIVHLTGPMIIQSGEELGRGFLVDMIGFDDGATLLAGRSVLTDEHGDRIYSTLTAEPIGAGRRGTGTITGGTGRYAGAEGSFSFTWEYAVESEGGEISVRSAKIEGRIRRAPASGGGAPR